MQLLPGAAHLMRKPVEFKIGDAINGLLTAAAAPAGERLDAGQQLRERVGFGEIIVAAAAQTFDPVVDLTKRGENEHRRLNGLAA